MLECFLQFAREVECGQPNRWALENPIFYKAIAGLFLTAALAGACLYVGIDWLPNRLSGTGLNGDWLQMVKRQTKPNCAFAVSRRL